MGLVREIGFAQSFSFKYSSRPGTPAAAARRQIAEDVKSARLERLQSLLNEQEAHYLRASLGLEVDLLLEKPGRVAGQMIGRSPYLQPVHVMARDHVIGEMARVRVTNVMAHSLGADLVSSFAPAAVAI
jgi:tRNA-2-methylthio-N6-dimethylallyladenosine synthase